MTDLEIEKIECFLAKRDNNNFAKNILEQIVISHQRQKEYIIRKCINYKIIEKILQGDENVTI
jgi:hypothetical protein